MTYEDSRNAISLQASADGREPSSSQDGQSIDLYGQDQPPASHGATQAHPGSPPSSAASTTSGTFGLSSSGSLRSVALQECLASRLRVRLASLGSPLYELTWKVLDMPLGLPICQLQARALRISGSEFAGLPTPAASDYKGSPSLRRVNEQAALSKRGVRLPEHLSKVLQIEVGCNMNPDLPRWLMGYPPDWLDLLLADSETP